MTKAWKHNSKKGHLIAIPGPNQESTDPYISTGDGIERKIGLFIGDFLSFLQWTHLLCHGTSVNTFNKVQELYFSITRLTLQLLKRLNQIRE